MPRAKNPSVLAWIDRRLREDPQFKSDVHAELAAMRYQQDLVLLRERAGLSQRDLAARIGVTQPVVARLEAGTARNVEVRTLIRAAAALGGRVVLRIERDRRRRAVRTASGQTTNRKTA
jgi:ribosome-binding protein aMBF1 (putative translation factor)